MYESFSTRWEEPEIKWLAKGLGVTERQVKKSLELLLRLGLLENKDRKYKKKDAVLETPDEMQSLLVRNYHKTTIQTALDKLGSLPTEERELGAVVFPLSKKSFEKLRKKIRKFRADISTLFAEDLDPEKVIQVNIQAFPIMDLKNRDSE